MVATVSHEIKSPLGIIRSTAELLEKRIKNSGRAHAHSPPVGDGRAGRPTVGLSRSFGPRPHPRLLTTVAPLRGRKAGAVKPGAAATGILGPPPATSAQTVHLPDPSFRDSPATASIPITGRSNRPATPVDGSGACEAPANSRMPEACQRVAGGRSAAQTPGTHAQATDPGQGSHKKRKAVVRSFEAGSPSKERDLRHAGRMPALPSVRAHACSPPARATPSRRSPRPPRCGRSANRAATTGVCRGVRRGGRSRACRCSRAGPPICRSAAGRAMPWAG